MAVHDEDLRFVGRLARGNDLLDAEARGESVHRVAFAISERQSKRIEVLLALVLWPPEFGVLYDELWVVFRREGDGCVFSPLQLHLLGNEGDTSGFVVFDGSADGVFSAVRAGIPYLDTDCLFRRIIVRMGKFRGDIRAAQLLGTRCIESNRAPDAGVAVADAVFVGEVPAHRHQLRYVLPNPSIASVVPLANGSPTFRRSCSRHIDREDTNGNSRCLPGLHGAVGDVERLAVEHACHRANHIAVDPYLGSVVDTHRLEPDALALIVGWHDELSSEPIGIELSSHFRNVGNDVVGKFVGLPEVRLWIDLLLDKVRQDCCRHNGFCPSLRIKTRHRDVSTSQLCLSITHHVPSLAASVPKARVEGDVVLPIASHGGQHCDECQ